MIGMTSILLWDEGWPVGRHEVSDLGLWWGGARHRSERQNFRPIWATVGATLKAAAQLPLASQAVRLRPARMAVGYSPLRAAGLW
jgi:hypothetical protein